jgi:hypothetical protein
LSTEQKALVIEPRFMRALHNIYSKVSYICLPRRHDNVEFTPAARGGKSTKGNIVTACKECNNANKVVLG